MTAAISVAVARRRRGRGLRLDRQHLRLDGGLRRQGRAQAARARPRGQDRGRQDGAGDRARRPGHHGARQLRRLPAAWPRELAWDYPVALVNSVNPVRLEGQKTAAFEIVDFLGDAPDFHLLPVGNAGNISAYWLGYTQYADLGRATRTPGDARLPGRGRRAAGDRRAVPRPRDQGHRDPDRQPGLLEARRGRRATSPAAGSPRSPTTRSSPPSASSPRRDGVFVEPASAAGVAGLLQDLAQGESYAGSDGRRHGDRPRPQGHRHRARGLRPTSSTPSSTPTSTPPPRAAGLA